MSLKETFCPSPWMHMRISPDGGYQTCRWQKDWFDRPKSITQVSPIEFFQSDMRSVRKAMLDGEHLEMCDNCHRMEQYGKVSGRQRQLLKAGVELENFEKSLLSSPMMPYFKESMSDGDTSLLPIDWQVDLGNHCNGRCVYCHPDYSSSLATEWRSLGLIDKMPDKAWTEDEERVQEFIDTLIATDQLAYIHFLGGETVITPSFKRMLQALVDGGVSQRVTIGFTTNLTVWREDVVDLLTEFGNVNLGMSVECFHSVNDYARFPSQIDEVTDITKRWIDLGRDNGWLIQFRITPTLLTISNLWTVYDFAFENGIAVESCNFLEEPRCLRPSVLPREQREEALEKLKHWVSSHDIESETVINTRDPSYAQEQVVQDARSYVKYLESAPYETGLLPDLVKFLKTLESNRKNSILDYLPEYEEFLRTAGY